jgi:hypothetical protein
MPAPSKQVTIGDRGAASPAPDDVGALFAAGTAEKGPANTPVDCRSSATALATFGDSELSRAAERYFREGGTRFVGTRAVGPAAANASVQIPGTSGNTLVATADGPGAYANGSTGGFKVEIANGPTGSTTRVAIVKFDDVEVARTDESTDRNDLVGPIGGITLTAGAGSGLPTVTAGLSLASGTDDAASITITEKTTAINAADADEGPGTVAYPGDTTTAVHQALLTHARLNNRFALCDAPDTGTVATLTAAAATLRAIVADAPYGQLLAPWEEVPYAGTTIVVPPSASQAGRMARCDRENVAGPGQPAAGRFAVSAFSTDVTQTWTKDERDVLSEAGVTVIRNIRGQVQAFDGLTLADPNLYPQYAEASGMRVLMAIANAGGQVLDQYVLAVIDGKRHLLVNLASDLTGVCAGWYQRNALYGEVSSEAFRVDTGPGVNPDAQLAARKIAAQLELRTSPFASTVVLNITKVASGDTI